MGIRANFDTRDLNNYVERFFEKLHTSVVMRLSYVGEKVVNHAREFGSYTDRTGNLRSSVGYGIYYNGRPVKNYFPTGTEQGISTGADIAQMVSRKFTRGYVLVVVAGMKYAAHVEITGRNVLSTAEHLAEAKAPEIIKMLKNKLGIDVI